MLEQIDHRGKRFAIGDENIDDAVVERCRRSEALERAKAVADPAGANPDSEVLER